MSQQRSLDQNKQSYQLSAPHGKSSGRHGLKLNSPTAVKIRHCRPYFHTCFQQNVSSGADVLQTPFSEQARHINCVYAHNACTRCSGACTRHINPTMNNRRLCSQSRSPLQKSSLYLVQCRASRCESSSVQRILSSPGASPTLGRNLISPPNPGNCEGDIPQQFLGT
jgi:hypothetical protein